VKPVFCRALNEIDGECGVKLAKCFTDSDSDQMREAHVEQMKGYFASMYVGLDLSECKIEEVAKVEEDDVIDDDDEAAEAEEDEEEDPFAGDESSEDGPSFLDDPLLDYPGESNDISGGGPSQRSTPDDADTSVVKTPSTTTTTTTTTADTDSGEKAVRAASMADKSSASATSSGAAALVLGLVTSFWSRR